MKKENEELAMLHLNQAIDTSLVLFLSVTSLGNTGEIAVIILIIFKALDSFESVIKTHIKNRDAVVWKGAELHKKAILWDTFTFPVLVAS